jgi:hypothetical protein
MLATAGFNVLRAATSGRASRAAASTCAQAVANLQDYEEIEKPLACIKKPDLD